MTGWLTTQDFADAIGKSRSLIYKMIGQNDARLRFEKLGRDYLVARECLAAFKKPKPEKALRTNGNKGNNHGRQKRSR